MSRARDKGIMIIGVTTKTHKQLMELDAHTDRRSNLIIIDIIPIILAD